jgi:hypothetical protein
MATQYDELGPNYHQWSTADNLLAGDMKRVERDVTIPQGQPAMVRGQLLKADGTRVTLAADSPRMVLAVDVPAAATGDIQAYAYETGEFNEAALVGYSATEHKPILEALNIYPRPIF